MLWFAVDSYHRQRYFFICGGERTVTRARRDVTAGLPPIKTNPGHVTNPVSIAVWQFFIQPSGQICAVGLAFYPLSPKETPHERNPHSDVHSRIHNTGHPGRIALYPLVFK